MDGSSSSVDITPSSQRHLLKGSEWLPLGNALDSAALEERTLKNSSRLGELELVVAKLSGQLAEALPGSVGQVAPAVSSHRLEAVEAAYQDLRHSLREVSSLPEASERLLRQELGQAVAQLRQELELESAKRQRHAAEIAKIEAAGAQLARRVEEVECQLREVRQDHASQTVAFKGRLEVAVRECDQAALKADKLQAAMKANVAQEVDQLRERLQLECAKVEQSALGVERVEAAGVELSRGLRESDQKLWELQQMLQKQSTEIVAMQSRLNVATREGNERVVQADSLRALVQGENDRRMSEASALLARVEAVEQAVQAAGEVHVTTLLSRLEKLEEPSSDIQRAEEVAGLAKRLETIERQFAAELQVRAPETARLASLSGEIEGLRGRLETVEKCSQPAVEQKKDMLPAALAVAAVMPSEIDELRSALVATSNDVACLARRLAAVREEHDAAITGIGGLTEFVAKTAVTSIRRSENRLTKELAARREELERAATSILRVSPALSSQAKAPGAPAVAGSSARQGTEMQAADASRLGAIAAQLREEAAAQAAAAEARTAAAETAITADLQRVRGQLEGTRMDVRDLLPRVAALEAAVAVAARGQVSGLGTPRPLHRLMAPEQKVPSGAAPVSPCPYPCRHGAGPAEADAAGASPLSQGSGVFPVSPASLSEEISASRRANDDRSASPLRGSLQQGVVWPGTARSSSPSRLLTSFDLAAQQQPQGLLVQKVEGIISSVHQTLGALEAKSQPAEPAGRPGQAQLFSMVAGPSSPTTSRAQSTTPSASAATLRGSVPGLFVSGGQSPAQPPPAQLRDAMSDTAMRRSSAPATPSGTRWCSPRLQGATARLQPSRTSVFGLGSGPSAPLRGETVAARPAPAVWQPGQGSPTAGLRGPEGPRAV